MRTGTTTLMSFGLSPIPCPLRITVLLTAVPQNLIFAINYSIFLSAPHYHTSPDLRMRGAEIPHRTTPAHIDRRRQRRNSLQGATLLFVNACNPHVCIFFFWRPAPNHRCNASNYCFGTQFSALLDACTLHAIASSKHNVDQLQPANAELSASELRLRARNASQHRRRRR